jgi:hypothetical protein
LLEAQVALRRALALNPELASAWEHLAWLTAGTDTTMHRRSLDRLVRLGFYPRQESAGFRGARFLAGISENEGEVPAALRPLLDSIARDRSTLPFEGFRWSVLYPLAYGFPGATIEIDRRLAREGLTPQYRAEVLRSSALSWATRGAWDSALVYLDRMVGEGGSPSAASHAYSLTVLGAWLGALDPEQAVRRRGAAVEALPRIPEDIREVRRLCLYWLDGVLGFVRHDRAALMEARAALERLHTRGGDANAAILSAFARALDGHEAEAGRRLAAMEWQRADLADDDGSRYDCLLTRMAAATWLARAGQQEEAIRLLRAAGSFGYAGKLADTYVAAGPAHLALARLLERRGDRAEALDSYRQFLRRVDLPDPPLRASVKEAESAVARLTGAQKL